MALTTHFLVLDFSLVLATIALMYILYRLLRCAIIRAKTLQHKWRQTFFSFLFSDNIDNWNVEQSWSALLFSIKAALCISFLFNGTSDAAMSTSGMQYETKTVFRSVRVTKIRNKINDANTQNEKKIRLHSRCSSIIRVNPSRRTLLPFPVVIKRTLKTGAR